MNRSAQWLWISKGNFDQTRDLINCEIPTPDNSGLDQNGPYDAVNLILAVRPGRAVIWLVSLYLTAEPAGLKFIPTWVGHQASCTAGQSPG
jgi:hypothetical protein